MVMLERHRKTTGNLLGFQLRYVKRLCLVCEAEMMICFDRVSIGNLK